MVIRLIRDWEKGGEGEGGVRRWGKDGNYI